MNPLADTASNNMSLGDIPITVAILARNKAHCLPLYLECLRCQTIDPSKLYLYIRTNDNHDATEAILRQWVLQHGHRYGHVEIDATSIGSSTGTSTGSDMTSMGHDWPIHRRAILGRLRQASLNWAKNHRSHYFVADVDTFLHPQTLQALISTHLPVVAPFLVTGSTTYSNYHHRVTADGYCRETPEYHTIHRQEVQGLILVDLVHCTYLIRHPYTSMTSYVDDGTGRHEYVIMAEHLRRQEIPQYLDNRYIYGHVTFALTSDDLASEPWRSAYPDVIDPNMIIS